MSDEADGFLARWARRKDRTRTGAPEPPAPPVVERSGGGGGPVIGAAPAPPADPRTASAVALPATSPDAPPAAPERGAEPRIASPTRAPAEPAPTMADVQRLTHASDFSRFALPGVDPDVKRAAMKKLFTDPHFNVMDGLDTYIDDYGKPDPLPLSMLRQMHQSVALGLFADEPAANAATAEGSTRGEGPAPVAQSILPADSPAPLGATAPTPSDDVPDLRLQQDDAAGPGGPDPGARP